jgi:hypothetical protein
MTAMQRKKSFSPYPFMSATGQKQLTKYDQTQREINLKRGEINGSALAHN